VVRDFTDSEPGWRRSAARKPATVGARSWLSPTSEQSAEHIRSHWLLRASVPSSSADMIVGGGLETNVSGGRLPPVLAALDTFWG
jgi:hypothetical protein